MKAWKVQKLFGDIVYDLRSRGLLPVVGLILFAMVAVPMLVSRGGTSTTASLQPTAVAAQTAPESEHAVVSYSPPGLRDYKKRLGGVSAKDPFAQQFSHSAATASALSSTVAVQSTGTGTSSSSAVSGSSNSTGGSSGGGKKKHKKKGSTTAPVVTYETDLLAGDVDTTLTPFNNVASMTPLPSQTTPVVIYFGLSSDASTALFLVSNKVASVNGPGTCVPSPDDCALLSLKQGQSEDLLYTGDGKIYRIVVAQIKRFTK